jgi:hypothetical protein
MAQLAPEELAVELFRADQTMEREYHRFFNFPHDGANFKGDINPVGLPARFLDERHWTPLLVNPGAVLEIEHWEHPQRRSSYEQCGSMQRHFAVADHSRV